MKQGVWEVGDNKIITGRPSKHPDMRSIPENIIRYPSDVPILDQLAQH